MLGLSLEEITEIGKLFVPGQYFKDGGRNRLVNILKGADQQFGISRRAAYLATSIQCEQPFNNGNTRTATAAMLALIMNERGQFLSTRAYQAYAMVGHHGPLRPYAPAATMMTMANWIESKLYGPGNLQVAWNNMMNDLLNVQASVEEMRAIQLDGDNRSDPRARALKAQKKSFMRHGGY
jgi:hypothetical protein